MGNKGCYGTAHNYSFTNKKLLQITRHSKRKNSNNSYEKEKEMEEKCLDVENINLQGSPVLLIFDVEQEKIYQIEVKLRIIDSLKGISQITINNNLYLCGSENSSDNGSYLLKVNSDNYNKYDYNSLESDILISSRFSHFSPSLFHIENKIFVIGGLKNTRCEIYEIDQQKWRYLPDLPQERYRCSLMTDSKVEYLYLVGGITSENKIYNSSILMLNIKNFISWEEINVEEGSEYISKVNCACFGYFDRLTSKDYIILLGGKNSEGVTDEVIKYDISEKKAKNTNVSLKVKAEFHNQYMIEKNNYYFIFDKKSILHTINSNELTSSLTNVKSFFNNE